jgi:hemerythrin-like domain-containing protein
VESIAAYISMLRRHIHKEDKTFYPLVDTFLSEDDQRYLKEEFFKEDRKSGGSILEDSQKIVEEMRALL